MEKHKPARTWSLIAIDQDARQYGGNAGYDDNLETTYRYDNAVANHTQLSAGDLVFVRGRNSLIGVARIEQVSTSPVSKTRNRCPVCNEVNIKARKSRKPAWRCRQGHEFDAPLTDRVQMTGYAAHYGKSYIATPEGVPVAAIRAAALRPNDQLSIEELDLAKLEPVLAKNFPATRELIAQFLESQILDAADALDTPDEPEEEAPGDYAPSMTDTREAVDRSILVRRGQTKFRNGLLSTRGGQCQVTGCGAADILEAAHIDPYRDTAHNNLSNGLLLRSDIHTLFDLHLMAVDPQALLLRFHPRIIAQGYANYEGQPLAIGKSGKPAADALKRRWESFQERLLK